MRFLGWAYNYNFKQAWRHYTIRGRTADRIALTTYLDTTYGGKSYLYYNGRSALSVALKTLLGAKVVGAKIGVNAYTCYSVIQAVEDTGAKVVFLDIDKQTFNFSAKTLAETAKKHRLQAVIIQNTLGFTADIKTIDKVCKLAKIKIIEDLAHSVGLDYSDGRKVGTVGDATFFSFGRGKPVDVEHGAALVLRNQFTDAKIYTPTKMPRLRYRRSDRLYPVVGWKVRTFYRVGGKVIAWIALNTGLIAKSAEGKVQPHVTITNWQARLVLEQLQAGPKMSRTPLLVENRNQVLKALTNNGYFFSDIWWDAAIGPRRLFSKVTNFDPTKTPIAYEVGEKMINLPIDLTAKEKKEIIKIIKEAGGAGDGK
ncbi:DegT/DnrJ/EryC1/StrS family aminotransferase [Candidatus Saccharibacteria bacterium]|nr:DegT/DnrJ/EryC1/StrS family aminotransferase [Candidatus Saccharibacteria bacterium]